MYVITKKNTHEVPNEVYFASSLMEATTLKNELTTETGDEWIIATELD